MVSENTELRKSDRISLHSKELIRNLQEWIELKIQLSLLQFLDSVRNRRKTICFALMAFFSLIGSIGFFLIAAALGLGSLFQSIIWGFVTVAIFLLLVSWLFYRFSIHPSANHQVISDHFTSTNGQAQSGSHPEKN